ncbi:MAG: hypothetical protein AAGA85_25635 [Bacteroidota bacterium]
MNYLVKPYILVLAVQLSILPQTVQAQDEGFIYGKITMEDGDVYQGALRWGKEEVYWTDMFNASKTENSNLDYLSRRDIDELRYQKRGWDDRVTTWVSSNWSGRDRNFIHQFSCMFGEIKTIRPSRWDEVMVTLQDGTEIEVDGDGYNDIGNKIKVLDDEIGRIELSWNRIEEIEFRDTPKKLEEKFGDPLFGTVKTSIGEFTGFVQWDHDERVTTDKLDGDTYDGDVSIAFGKIKSIENRGSRSLVTLMSGRELELRGSNDVNSGNRGIIVTVAGLGRIDIPWRDFDSVEFVENPTNSGPAYSSFGKNRKLAGTVNTTNGDLKGEIIFDLDEAYDFEVLNGRDDDIEYVIPFGNIQEIKPRGYRSSEVTLRDGSSLRLERSQDVSEDNTGLLVFDGNEPTYVVWEEIERIQFD